MSIGGGGGGGGEGGGGSWGSVRVNGPAGEDVYINGSYSEPAGTTNTTFTVELGLNTFETLDEDGAVALRADIDVTVGTQAQEVTLR